MNNLIAERVRGKSLTKSQRKIADYFIRNQERIAALSSLEAAEEIGVSDASIIRFSRAIGYKGYADLKADIYRSLVEDAGRGISLGERLDLNAEKYGTGSVRFLELMQQNITAVFRQNRPEDFEKIADILIASKNRYVVGMRGCRGMAVKFGRILTFMLPGVHTLTDGECPSISSLQDISGEDVLLMFVFSRFYKIDLQMVKLAGQRGAKVLLVTDDPAGPLSPYADMTLLTASSNMSFFHSTAATELIGEYILDLISTRVDCRERIEERDRITGEQRL